MGSRSKNTMRNVIWGYVSQMITFVAKFISRTVFIHYLGANYLGVSGLFTNVLGVLSFTELGIGAAMNYALYKPVAVQDHEKIKSIMRLYKIAYRVVAITIFVSGLLLTPFLKYIIKNPGNIGNIYIYYFIILFDTATSYLITYKFSIVYAEQKNYILTNISTIFMIISTIIQIVVMVLFKSYLLYLICGSVSGVITKIIWSVYIDKKYPYLSEKAQPLDGAEILGIRKNVLALFIHKIGDVCVHQTDNILISTFVSISVVGKISNYNYIITTVSGFLTIIFSSVIASLGNYIAIENKEKQNEIFKIYRFVGFWLYGFCALTYFCLFQPFITLWAGAEWCVDDLTIALICLDKYFVGHRVVAGNFKTAAGVFDKDKWVAFCQAIINLVVSIAMVKLVGLPGIYIGTVVQGFLPTLVKPYIICKYITMKPFIGYLRDSIKYLCVEACALGFVLMMKKSVFSFGFADMRIRFIVLMALDAIVINAIYILLLHRTDEYKYMKNFVIKYIRGLVNRE